MNTTRLPVFFPFPWTLGRGEVDTSWLKNITELETGAGLSRELGHKRGGHVRGPKKKSVNRRRRRGLRHHGPHEDLWGHTKREISNENLLNQFFHSIDPPPDWVGCCRGSAKGVSSRFGGTDQDHQDCGEEVQRLTIKSEPLSSFLAVRCWRRLSPVSGLGLYASKSSSDLLLSTGVLRLSDCSSRL